MADKWTSSVITNAGISMLGEAMSGDELIISRAALGGGTVDEAALMAQTTLTQPLTVPVVIAKKKLVEGKGLNICIQIRNIDVSTTQVMRQVGLLAKIGSDGDEKLFAIMQDSLGEEIPSASSYPDFMLEFTAAVAVSNTGAITVNISGSTVITAADLEEVLEDYATKAEIEDKANKSDIPTSLPANGGNAETLDGKHASNFATVKKITTQAEVDSILESGIYSVEYLATTFGSIESSYYMMVVNRHRADVNYNVEIAVPYADGKQQGVYYRNCTNGIWGAWTNVADGGNAAALRTSGEDGTPYGDSYLMAAQYNKSGDQTFRFFVGNGEVWVSVDKADHAINSDTLDGKHASDFLQKANGALSEPLKWNDASLPAQTGEMQFLLGIDAFAEGGTTRWKSAADITVGNASKSNGHTVNADVPAGAVFTDTTYPAASTTANGIVTTGAQTFEGAKTFNGQVSAAGASAIGTAQVRNIYAGTADLTAGTSALATGSIYLVYE